MSAAATARRGVVLQPVAAGAVASLIGFLGSFPIVLAGLHAVGADAAQASSALLALSVVMGVTAVGLSVRLRMPISVAWSTPGAALLVAAGAFPAGFAAAVGAFLVTGALIALAGLWRPLGRWIAAIPAPIASAMLAGVLLPVCVAPVQAVGEIPWLVAPAIVTWLALMRLARPWAVPAAVAATVLVVAVDRPPDLASAELLAAPVVTAPVLDVAAVVGLALPLFVVTMASQNITGMGVLAGFGYRPPLGPVLRATGAATVAAAPLGGHAVNLAALTAALVAGPEAAPDPRRRWIAAASGGVTYVALGLASGLVIALVATAPPLLIEAVAGLALLAALAGALAAAAADAERREAAAVTFVVSASAVTLAGVSAPFWGLLAGLAYLGLQRAGRRSPVATTG